MIGENLYKEFEKVGLICMFFKFVLDFWRDYLDVLKVVNRIFRGRCRVKCKIGNGILKIYKLIIIFINV